MGIERGGSQGFDEFVFGKVAAAISPGLGMAICGERFTEADWDAYVECWRTTIGPRIASEKSGFLIFAPDDGPSAKQRAQLSGDVQIAACMKQCTRLALVTDSVMVRGAVTAMNWLSGAGSTSRTFSPSQLDSAMKWLAEGTAFSIPTATVVVRTLAAKVNVNQVHLRKAA